MARTASITGSSSGHTTAIRSQSSLRCISFSVGGVVRLFSSRMSCISCSSNVGAGSLVVVSATATRMRQNEDSSTRASAVICRLMSFSICRLLLKCPLRVRLYFMVSWLVPPTCNNTGTGIRVPVEGVDNSPELWMQEKDVNSKAIDVFFFFVCCRVARWAPVPHVSIVFAVDWLAAPSAGVLDDWSELVADGTAVGVAVLVGQSNATFYTCVNTVGADVLFTPPIYTMQAFPALGTFHVM